MISNGRIHGHARASRSRDVFQASGNARIGEHLAAGESLRATSSNKTLRLSVRPSNEQSFGGIEQGNE